MASFIWKIDIKPILKGKSFYIAVDSILFFTVLKFILTYIGKIFLGGNIQVSLFI